MKSRSELSKMGHLLAMLFVMELTSRFPVYKLRASLEVMAEPEKPWVGQEGSDQQKLEMNSQMGLFPHLCRFCPTHGKGMGE